MAKVKRFLKRVGRLLQSLADAGGGRVGLMATLTADQQAGMDQHLRILENAVGIVQLRLSSDEWARQQGEKMLPDADTVALLGFIAQTALAVRIIVEEAEAS